ncbi:MAG: bifunctional aconitate hydratase 2/2-methylisocitrate dehydratase, partial [Pseudomonadota bacterium]
MIEEYTKHVAEREAEGLPPLPLNAEQTAALVELVKEPPAGEEEFLLDLLTNRVPPGVDDAAYVKAAFLTDIAKGEASSPLLAPREAAKLLGTMRGGYNIQSLVDLLDDDDLAPIAAQALSKTLLVFDAYNDVLHKAKTNNWAKEVIENWAEASWFTSRPELPKAITVTVFKVPGETNTDDLSPASEAWSRPDIPLHAKAMLVSKMPDAMEKMAELLEKGNPLAFVGDVVGTGSSRKSAINSVLWHMGDDIPFVPNKRQGGVVIGGKIAPIFFNTAEDSGALPIECDVSKLEMGEVITIKPYEGKILNQDGEVLAEFNLKPSTMLDEVRAGGRIPLIIGRSLTDKTREALGLEPSRVFKRPELPDDSERGFTLA